MSDRAGEVLRLPAFALIAGGLATAFGFRVTIGVSVVIFVIAALIVLLSPLRTARHEDA